MLPRLGGIVDVLPGLSLYASYSEGLKANPYALFFGPPQPEESTQKEVGVKFRIADQLSGTLALFDIERSKVPVGGFGPFGAFSLPIGEQRSRGFDTDILWQPSRSIKLLANYAYVDAELTKETSTAAAGNGLVGVPQHSGRVWLDYALDGWNAKGWSVGAGIYAQSSAFVDLPNLYRTPGYFTVDAKIAYEAEHYKAAFNVKNLTGEEYFVPYNYFNGRVAPGADRSFYGTLAYKY